MELTIDRFHDCIEMQLIGADIDFYQGSVER